MGGMANGDLKKLEINPSHWKNWASYILKQANDNPDKRGGFILNLVVDTYPENKGHEKN